MFEGAPTPVRLVLAIGWRAGLRLRLRPDVSTPSNAGWSVVGATDDEVVLSAQSRLLTAVKTVRTSGADLIVATDVEYTTRLGRILWHAVLPFHLLVEPYLLARVARRTG